MIVDRALVDGRFMQFGGHARNWRSVSHGLRNRGHRVLDLLQGRFPTKDVAFDIFSTAYIELGFTYKRPTHTLYRDMDKKSWDSTLDPLRLYAWVWSHKELRRATRSYKALQRARKSYATKSYEELRGSTKRYKELQRATKSYKELQRAAKSSKEPQRARKSYKEPQKAAKELQRATKSYKELQRSYKELQRATKS